MAAGRLDLLIEQGARFTRTFRRELADGTPVDTSAYAARAQIRRERGGKRSEPDVTFHSDPAVGADGLIEIDGPAGEITIDLGATKTAAVTFRRGRWDLELFDPLDPDNVIRLLEGLVEVDREVTRG